MQALSIQSRDVVAPATRGLIVDGYGVPLAMNKAGLAITIDRIAIDKLDDKGDAVMKRLAKLLNLQYTGYLSKTHDYAVNFQRVKKLDVGRVLDTNQFQLQNLQILTLHFKSWNVQIHFQV